MNIFPSHTAIIIVFASNTNIMRGSESLDESLSANTTECINKFHRKLLVPTQ
ncbi:hypothetical protein CDL15_Pgr008556 [Punica granatum]|uniref:Uncharacterized protein n=1 Tax=Punica granatum TaxID=22663 RepID=A0A218WQH8_PUNGR|nr:hypothetical protein CDL15_Pgr008556 [Punica granatum]